MKRLGWLAAVALLLVACNRASPTAAPTSTVASATATAPSTPTFLAGAPAAQPTQPAAGSATGIASQGAIFTSPRYSYTVILPCCWMALPTPGTAMESALAGMDNGGEAPLWGDLDEQVSQGQSGAVLELIALLPDEENPAVPVAQATVSVLPSHDLTLAGYLAATTAELNSIANTAVVTGYIEPSLGVGAFPAVVIEYTAAPTTQLPNTVEKTIAGLQVAFFGQGSDTLIVLTFTTTDDRFEQLKPEFLHIVRTVTLGEPAV
jgi:hypothetical protein